MKLQEPPNCVSRSVQFSAAVVDYVDPEDGCNKVYPLLGGLSRDTRYAWISRGPNFEVISTDNGEKVAAWTFGGILKDTNTKVTCAVELPTVEDGYGVSISSLYAVGLDCYLSFGMVCLFDIQGSKILKAIQVPGKVTSLAVVDPGLIPEATTSLAPALRLAKGVLAVGLSPGGRMLLLDLCLSEEDGAVAEGVASVEEEYLPGASRPHTEHSDELNPSCIVIHAPGDPRTEGPVAPGEHIAILLNEQSFSNGFFMLKLSESTYRLPLSHVEITGSLYVPQLASLFIGFSFGCFQVWDLSNLTLVHTSALLSEPRNITFFAFQEPADDPRKYCYMWAVYGKRWEKGGKEGEDKREANTSHHDDGDEDDKVDQAFACMHDMCYQSKEWIDGYGWLYQDFVSIRPRFELEFTHGNELRSVSRCISCHSVDGNQGRGRANFAGRLETTDFEEGCSAENDLSLCCMTWQSWQLGMDGVPCNLRHSLTLFDLNQWYREQMPSNSAPLVVSSPDPNNDYLSDDVEGHPGSPHLLTYALPFVTEKVLSANGAPLLFARIDPTSISRFCATAIPIPEEHLFPSALSFESSFLLGSQCVIKMSTPGLQRSLLAKLQFLGPKSYLYPTPIFYECVTAGLKPLYVDIHNAATTPVSEQREFLLSLALEHHLVSYLIRCAVETADGRASSLGVTLGFLMSWVKERAWVIKECITKLSVPLFECGGALLPDPQAARLMSLCGRQLNHLSTLLKEILKRCISWILVDVSQEMQQWCEVLGVLALHTEVVQWFCHVGLLPELADEDTTAAEIQASTLGVPRIPYPAKTLSEAYEKRRKELEGLPGVSHVSDVLFIDGAVKECGDRLTKETWQSRGSKISGQYPPPSLQALLLTYLLDGLPVEDKHCLVIYLFLDIAALLSNERYGSSLSQLIKFPSAFSLSPSIIKLTQAFWLLDHKDFEVAINVFLDPLICPQDIKLWQHRCVVRAFLAQGEPQKALKYVRVRQPPLGGIEDLKLNLTLLLENGLVHEAFNYQRKHRNDQNSQELLQHFFNGCGDLKQLRWVLQNSLTPSEEDGLIDFLSSQKDAKAQELCVMYYLQRSRVIEALRVNDSQRTSKKERRKTVDNGRNKNLKTVRDAIVSGYASALPSVTRRLAAYCARHSGTVHSWKEVTRPVPMSVDIHHAKEVPSVPFRTKATLIGTMLDKARETWNPPPLPPIAPPTPRPPPPSARALLSSGPREKRKREEEDGLDVLSLLPSRRVPFSPLRSSVESMPFICTPVAPSQSRSRNGDGPPLIFPSQAKSMTDMEDVGTPLKRARFASSSKILTSSPVEKVNDMDDTSTHSSALLLLQTPTVPRKNRKATYIHRTDREEYSSTGSGGSTPTREAPPPTPQSILKVRKTRNASVASPSLTTNYSHIVEEEEEEEVEEEEEAAHGLGRLIRFQLPTGLTPSPTVASPILYNDYNQRERLGATPRQPLQRSPLTSLGRQPLPRMQHQPSPAKKSPTHFESRTESTSSTKTKTVTTIYRESSVEMESNKSKVDQHKGPRPRSAIHQSLDTLRKNRDSECGSGDDSGEFYSFEEAKDADLRKDSAKATTEERVRTETFPTDSYGKLFASPYREVKVRRQSTLFKHQEEEEEVEADKDDEEEEAEIESSEEGDSRVKERLEQPIEEEEITEKDVAVKETERKKEDAEREEMEKSEDEESLIEEEAKDVVGREESLRHEELGEVEEEEGEPKKIEKEVDEEPAREELVDEEEQVEEENKEEGRLMEENVAEYDEVEREEEEAEGQSYRADGYQAEASEVLELGTSGIFPEDHEEDQEAAAKSSSIEEMPDYEEEEEDDEVKEDHDTSEGKESTEDKYVRAPQEDFQTKQVGSQVEDDDDVVVISDSDDEEQQENRNEEEGELGTEEENWEEEDEYAEEMEEYNKEGEAAGRSSDGEGREPWMSQWERESGIKEMMWTDQEREGMEEEEEGGGRYNVTEGGEQAEEEEMDDEMPPLQVVGVKMGGPRLRETSKSLIEQWEKEAGLDESQYDDDDEEIDEEEVEDDEDDDDDEEEEEDDEEEDEDDDEEDEEEECEEDEEEEEVTEEIREIDEVDEANEAVRELEKDQRIEISAREMGGEVQVVEEGEVKVDQGDDVSLKYVEGEGDAAEEVEEGGKVGVEVEDIEEAKEERVVETRDEIEEENVLEEEEAVEKEMVDEEMKGKEIEENQGVEECEIPKDVEEVSEAGADRSKEGIDVVDEVSEVEKSVMIKEDGVMINLEKERVVIEVMQKAEEIKGGQHEDAEILRDVESKEITEAGEEVVDKSVVADEASRSQTSESALLTDSNIELQPKEDADIVLVLESDNEDDVQNDKEVPLNESTQLTCHGKIEDTTEDVVEQDPKINSLAKEEREELAGSLSDKGMECYSVESVEENTMEEKLESSKLPIETVKESEEIVQVSAESVRESNFEAQCEVDSEKEEPKESMMEEEGRVEETIEMETVDKKDEETIEVETADKKDEETIEVETEDKKDEETIREETADEKDEETIEMETVDKKSEETIEVETEDKKDEETIGEETADKKDEETIEMETVDKKSEETIEVEREDKKVEVTTERETVDEKAEETLDDEEKSSDEVERDEVKVSGDSVQEEEETCEPLLEDVEKDEGLPEPEAARVESEDASAVEGSVRAAKDSINSASVSESDRLVSDTTEERSTSVSLVVCERTEVIESSLTKEEPKNLTLEKEGEVTQSDDGTEASKVEVEEMEEAKEKEEEEEEEEREEKPDVSSQIEEYATSRRLTRHQMSLLSRSLGGGEGILSPSTPLSAKKRVAKPKTSPRSVQQQPTSEPSSTSTPTSTPMPTTPLRSSARIRNLGSKTKSEKTPVAHSTHQSEGEERVSSPVENIPTDTTSSDVDPKVIQDVVKSDDDGKDSPVLWSSQLEERFKKFRKGSPALDPVARRTRRSSRTSVSPQSSVSTEIRQSPELRESPENRLMPEEVEVMVRRGSPAPSVTSSVASSVSQRGRRRSIRGKPDTEEERQLSPVEEVPHTPRTRQRSSEPDACAIRRSARLSRGTSLSPANDSESEASSYASSVTSTRSHLSQALEEREGGAVELTLRSGRKRARPPQVTPTKSGPRKKRSSRGSAARVLEMEKESDVVDEEALENLGVVKELDTAFVFSPPTAVASSAEGLGQMITISEFPLSPPKLVSHVPPPGHFLPGHRRSSIVSRRSVASLGPIPEVGDEEEEIPATPPPRRGRSLIAGTSKSKSGEASKGQIASWITPKKGSSKGKSRTEIVEHTDQEALAEAGSVVRKRSRGSSLSLQPIEELKAEEEVADKHVSKRRASHLQRKRSSPTSSVVSEGALDREDDSDSKPEEESNRTKDDSDALPRRRKSSSRSSLHRRKSIMPYKPRKSAKL